MNLLWIRTDCWTTWASPRPVAGDIENMPWPLKTTIRRHGENDTVAILSVNDYYNNGGGHRLLQRPVQHVQPIPSTGTTAPTAGF